MGTDRTGKRNVGIVIFNCTCELDFIEPFEVFVHVNDKKILPGKVKVFTVAQKKHNVKCAGGLEVKPHYTFSACPKLDVLIVPGGPDVTTKKESREIEGIIDFLKKKEEQRTFVASVCSGALILARTGLLHGRKMTTNYKRLGQLRHVNAERNMKMAIVGEDQD